MAEEGRGRSAEREEADMPRTFSRTVRRLSKSAALARAWDLEKVGAYVTV